MTTISPTRVSMYDFLYQDTKPLVSLLADAATLSLPQARLAMDASLQAIISALLAYQQRHQGQVLSKKLFGRSAVKELRQYNSMNFATLNATLYHRHDAADAIFHDNAGVSKASEYIAAKIDATAPQVQILLTTLCVIVLRELAILVEYSQLDHDEVNKWFALQPQFLSKDRFASPAPQSALNEPADDSDEKQTTLSAEETVEIESISSTERHLLSAEQLTDPPPAFDTYWYELTAFTPEQLKPVQDVQLATGNYLKAIGRSAENIQQGKHNDLLMFAPMTAIGLPHQRWLLQLAKISEIYLQRNRLRITSEPTNPPKPPLVSLGLIGSNSGNNDNTPATISEKPIEYEASVPLWKNPVILLIILVIGGLGVLATIKYQTQKSNGVILATEEVLEERQQQDVAIVMVDENMPNNDAKLKAE
ncbi:hypothetical protein Psyc_1630 [Psychrobacter arcticus 273-4]|uniref:Uncharacterized protein n=1 Tax=Psychrobacter arcticus (strain DSM 17307 / VKM B-2377 / 273-4) TaxID=259536 RepID=Q4FR80_PSYA2|nr:hypothetical protein [Psychrobacter arcticus]AAZ19478.1 hypothetical protein Psyc_1630 [Psychrobacter arcticus 273-4]